MPTGVELIAAKRQRQIEHHGYTPEHDDEHDLGELRFAAAWYCRRAARGGHLLVNPVPDTWLWEPEAWNPSADPIENLVNAGALIAAEIDRLQRMRDEPVDKSSHSL